MLEVSRLLRYTFYCAWRRKWQPTPVFFFFFFKFYFSFKLYNIVLVLPNIEMNLPQVYTCSPSWTLLPPPSPLPSLWVVPVHQPQASSIMHRTWAGDLFRIWYYTYFNAILPNHPTLSLSHRVQRLFYTSVSLLLSRIQGYCYHLSKYSQFLKGFPCCCP